MVRKQVSFGLVLLLAASVGLFGQEYRGSLSGRVLDPSGAAVPGAQMTLTNIETNVRFTTQTNADGNYTIPYVQPGTYSLRAEHAGFKVFERSPIQVRISQRVQVDAQLELGAATETVTVAAEAPLLDMGSASVGQTIDEKRLVDLPVQQGVPWHLISLSTGVVRTGTNMLDENPYDGTPTMYAVQGASSSANLITIDGVATGRGQPSFTPPQEAITELRVMTTNYDAAQGFTQGANVSVALKSGTNIPHGAVSWYGGGNGSLIANNYFNVVTGRPKSPSGPYFRRNASVGGPVYIPGVYNGKNRSFFYFSYEGIHRTQVLTQSFTVPSVLGRTGDFSDLLALGTEYQVYDPFSRQVAPNGRVSSLPLAGNKIPQSRIDPIAKGLMKIWPLPNQAGTANGTNNFYCNNSGQSNQYWGTSVRFDHNFTQRHRIYGTYYRSNRNNQDYNIFINDVSGGSWLSRPQGAVLDYVYVISSSFIADARMGYDRPNLHIRALGPVVNNWKYTDWGWPAYMDTLMDPAIRRMPSISAAGITGAPPGANLSWNVVNTFTPSLHLTKTFASHNMKFGWEGIIRQRNYFGPGIQASGNFYFGGSYTNGPLDNSPTAPMGQGLAQMLYGLPSSSSINRVPSYAVKSSAHGFYFQEDWRMTPKLTVNLGMRYEYWSGPAERFNRTVRGFDFTTPLPVEAQIQAAYRLNPIPEVSELRVRGGMLFAGVGGQPRTLNSPNHDFMPRIGFAYALTPKTVLHAGYGIFYGPGGYEFQNVRQTGFSRTTTTNASLDNGLTYKYPLANPFPDGVLEPVGAGLGLMTSVGSSAAFMVVDPDSLYIQRWGFDVQRELPWRVVVTAGYAGSRQTHLSTTKDLNALSNSYLSKLPVRDQATINYLTTNIPNPFRGVPGFEGTSLGSNTSVARNQLLRPFPQFTSVQVDTQQGYSWYHALNLAAERRLAKGFTVQASYTYSKSMEASSFLNGGDPVPTEMISSVDRPHYLALTSIYELPIGRGRALAGGISGLADFFVGGWQVQGMYRFQSGPPLGFSNPLFNSSCAGWKDVALPADQRTYSRWFKTECFNRTSAQQLSYNLVTTPSRFSWLRGDALSVLDLSAIKRFRIRERFGLEFRLESMNATNHVWLASPNTSPTSGAFGSINTEQSAPRRVYWSGRVTF